MAERAEEGRGVEGVGVKAGGVLVLVLGVGDAWGEAEVGDAEGEPWEAAEGDAAEVNAEPADAAGAGEGSAEARMSDARKRMNALGGRGMWVGVALGGALSAAAPPAVLVVVLGEDGAAGEDGAGEVEEVGDWAVEEAGAGSAARRLCDARRTGAGAGSGSTKKRGFTSASSSIPRSCAKANADAECASYADGAAEGDAE